MIILISIWVRNHWFVYTNKDRNEFAIGLKEDETFRAMTKVDEFYIKFVDAFDQIIDEYEIDWKHELKRWIAAAKKNETIFVEVDLSGYNEVADLNSPEAWNTNRVQP